MTLTQDQQKLVEKNMGLVGKVIKDKVHGLDQLRFFTYDDLYQIGCIGLCKAASSDKGGCFSTFAYRLIWNEICSALIYANRRAGRECELVPEILDVRQQEKEYSDLHSVLGKLRRKPLMRWSRGSVRSGSMPRAIPVQRSDRYWEKAPSALLREFPVLGNTLKISLPLRRFIRYELVYVGVEFRQAPHYNEGGRIFQRALLQCSYSCK